MRRCAFILLIFAVLIQPVFAVEIEAPRAPESAREYLPQESSTFSEDLIYILKAAFSALQPSITQASKSSLSILAIALLVSLTENLNSSIKSVTELTASLAISTILLKASKSFIHIGIDTVSEMSQYGKLLLPVMTAALAAQGGVTSSAALYAGTAFFGSFLSSIIANITVPLLYIFLCLSIVNNAVGKQSLKGLQDFSKWSMTWILKTILYIFTGYMTVTGVISGSADASAIKATKLAISGAVPVVGSIISDASEAILVSAGVMKNAAGVYGILAIIAICIGPFLRIAVQYLLLKITAGICSVFGTKRPAALLGDFSVAMGIVLAMTGTICLLYLISTVCFMKGIA